MNGLAQTLRRPGQGQDAGDAREGDQRSEARLGGCAVDERRTQQGEVGADRATSRGEALLGREQALGLLALAWIRRGLLVADAGGREGDQPAQTMRRPPAETFGELGERTRGEQTRRIGVLGPTPGKLSANPAHTVLGPPRQRRIPTDGLHSKGAREEQGEQVSPYPSGRPRHRHDLAVSAHRGMVGAIMRRVSIRPLLLFLGPATALLAGLIAHRTGMPWAAAITLGIVLWCALWWISEAVEAPVTALIPLTLLPLLGVLSPAQVAAAVGHEAILLLAGGFMLSRALVAVGLHRRFALAIIAAIGTSSPRRLVLAFTLSAGLLSMWVSNTATALMLLPIALALLEPHPLKSALTIPLLLAIAYGASIGGLGTPIGTPPNLIFLGVYRETSGRDIGFLEWMSFGLPLLAVFLPIVALWLTRGLPRRCPPLEGIAPEPGMSAAQRRVLAVFALTVALWIFRTQPAGGWAGLLGLSGANDATVALLAVLILLLLPDGRGGRVFSWPQATDIPWGILVLFAGGLALASAFSVSGLGAILAERLGAMAALPPLLIVLAVSSVMIFLTEITSNTAAAALAMPVLAAAASASGVDPALFMLPAALAASCAFMLPVATAPNAVVYASGLVPAQRMAREGLVLNLVGIVLLTLTGYLSLR